MFRKTYIQIYITHEVEQCNTPIEHLYYHLQVMLIFLCLSCLKFSFLKSKTDEPIETVIVH